MEFCRRSNQIKILLHRNIILNKHFIHNLFYFLRVMGRIPLLLQINLFPTEKYLQKAAIIDYIKNRTKFWHYHS